MSKSLIILLVMMLMGFGCDTTDNTGGQTQDGKWLIPKDQIYDGGPGKDGIPSIDNPNFSNAGSVTYLKEDDLVIGIKMGNEVRAYSHQVLDWHEIVNDEISGEKIALTYCPLTGSGIGWERVVNGTETTFGVSGLLYNSNLIPYDRKTNSNWSQMKLLAVNGSLAGSSAQIFDIVETTWKTWKELYPDSKVINTNTGYSRSYGNYPYGNYKSSNSLIFPVSHNDDRLHKKDRVLGVIINDEIKAYPIRNFTNVSIIKDEIGSKEIIVYGDNNKNIIKAFESVLSNGVKVELSILENNLPAIIIDSKGNKYDLFGEIIEGPDLGKKLVTVPSFIAYWFAWAAFYPQIEIYN